MPAASATLAKERQKLALAGEELASAFELEIVHKDGHLIPIGRAIKADAALQDTLLVLLTSVRQRGDAGRFTEAGFAAYLLKPVHQSQLFGSLATIRAAHQQGTTTPLVMRHC